MDKQIPETIDTLLREYRLDEAERYMTAELEKAQDDRETTLYLLNEMAGFYRDCGRFAESVACAERSESMFTDGEKASAPYTAALLNLANAYRAAGDKRAFGVYEKILPLAEKHRQYYSSYQNNIALLYQDSGEFDKAAQALELALDCEKDNDERKSAITRANLAVCLCRLGDLDRAEKTADMSVAYFKGLSPSDFHYSAALAAMGDIYSARGDKEKAALNYEAALSEILLHMGRNNFYDIVAEKLAHCYGGKRPHLSGTELSRRYFEQFGKPVLKRNFPELTKKTACGLFGEGSECFGFDDELSADHDFGPSFCIVCDDDMDSDSMERLRKAYSLLPPTYYGLTHSENENSAGRRGVMTVSDFFRRTIGNIPDTSEDFQLIPDENIAAAVNGEIYYDYSGQFSGIRQKLIHRPDADRYAKLSAQIEAMSKHGEYNYLRMKERHDDTAAMFCLSEYIQSAMRALHLIHGSFAPYMKWLSASAARLSPDFADICAKAVQTGGRQAVDSINSYIRSELVRHRFISDSDMPLALIAKELLDTARRINLSEKIIAIEWAMFDKVQNKGGGAFCQDDYTTFSIMRKSQYYTFDEELLRSVLTDFTAAKNCGRNVITEKYAYMMRYTVPDEFAVIETSLPVIGEKKQALIDAIAPIQVGWMEELAVNYPGLAGNARNIHTYEDTPTATSYETYLRGELATYSEDTLALYGAFIVGIYREGGNLAERIITNSVHMYGFDSLEEAEKAQ